MSFLVHAEELVGGVYSVQGARLNAADGVLTGGSYTMLGSILEVSGIVFGSGGTTSSVNTGYTSTSSATVVTPPVSSGGGGGGGGGGGSSGGICVGTATPLVTDTKNGSMINLFPPFGYSVVFNGVEYNQNTALKIYPQVTTKYYFDTVFRGVKYSSCSVTIIVKNSIAQKPACPVFATRLKPGAVGPEVGRVQLFLKSQGYSVDRIGRYGRKTTRAVIKFQNKYFQDIIIASGLKRSTGWWYDFTFSKANELTGCGDTSVRYEAVALATPQSIKLKNSCSPTRGQYRIGSKGEVVSRIQQFLVSQGYELPITGEYTFKTGQVVAEFQQRYFEEILGVQGFSRATGIWAGNTAKKAHELGFCAEAPSQEISNVKIEEKYTTQPKSAPSKKARASSQICLAERIEVGAVDSDNVRQIQRFLISQGYDSVRETGNYVADTIIAVKDFQLKYFDEILAPNGFKNPTGIWARATATKASQLGLCDI